jgi:hypothetical protein
MGGPLPIPSNPMGSRKGKNRKLTDLVNAILNISSLPRSGGGDILTSSHVLSRVLTKNKVITPFEEW